MGMRRFWPGFRWILALGLLFHGAAAAAGSGLPTIGGKKAVAVVNGEPISLEEFQRVLASLHEGGGEKPAGGRRNYSDLLRRLIDGKLVLQEARNIGLDKLPEVRETVKMFERQTLRQTLLSRQVKNVRPDGREVEKVYRDSIREFKVRSYLFAREEDAKQAEEEIRAGAGFDNVMKRMVAEGKAEGKEEGVYMKGKDLLPEIAGAVSILSEGGVTPALKVSAGRMGEAAYTILMLEAIRYPENPDAREQARRGVLKEARLAAIDKYVETLKKKYVVVRKDTLDGLDYEAKEPGIEKLMADPRVVAEIRGEKPIRVADLSRGVQQKFYHGVQQVATTKKVNRQVPEVLNEMVTTRVLVKEALRKKIDKTPEFKQKVKEFEDEVLFGMFVQKAINPDIKVDEGVVRKYYDDHGGEFLIPERMRGEDLAFAVREDAVDALEKLRRGADFKWVEANAPGQVGGKSRQMLFPAGGGEPPPLHDLPEGAREALSGVGAGESRLYTTPEGQFLVFHILEVIPPSSYPFDAVKGKIQERMFREAQQKSVEEWAEKLRAVSEIKIFATDREMEKIFGPAGGAAGTP
jgi:hypothetical protein